MYSNIAVDDLQPVIRALETRITYLTQKIDASNNVKEKSGVGRERAAIKRAIKVMVQERLERLGRIKSNKE